MGINKKAGFVEELNESDPSVSGILSVGPETEPKPKKDDDDLVTWEMSYNKSKKSTKEKKCQSADPEPDLDERKTDLRATQKITANVAQNLNPPAELGNQNS